MQLTITSYDEQAKSWPASGKHILAYYDDKSIIVYQAYKPSIGKYAIEHGRFGGDFSYSRMSWIKPNFLWMMYRSGWGTKPDQEVTLGIRLRRTFFDSLLSQAVVSSWNASTFATEEEWAQAVARSSVRLQWDPDHHPNGAKLERRALQLGMRGNVLESYGQREVLEIIDMSGFVEEQRQKLNIEGVLSISMPSERVYVPDDPDIIRNIQLDTIS